MSALLVRLALAPWKLALGLVILALAVVHWVFTGQRQTLSIAEHPKPLPGAAIYMDPTTWRSWR